MGYGGRDVEVVLLEDNQCLVAACDSCGGIGSKESDVVKVPASLTGRLTLRVALLEVLAAGADPKLVTAAVSNEPEPTGNEVLEGVREELKASRLNSIPIAISTEKNMPTSQTGLGITVVGVCRKNDLRIGFSKPGDNVYCLGLPKVGGEIKRPDDPEIVQPKDIIELRERNDLHDIVPIGSGGIRKEAELLAESTKGLFIQENLYELDLEHSGGPSTCLIFTSPEDIEAKDFKDIPFAKIGRII